jgi:hypothetical protein
MRCTGPNHTCVGSVESSSSATAGPPSVVSADASLWCCLVCGFLGCSIYASNHILQHYQETLHTYALNVASKQVWDFAGGGYVASRLTTASPDDAVGATAASSSASSSLGACAGPRKIIEVHRADGLTAADSGRPAPVSAWGRSLSVAALSSEDESAVVNRELELAAAEFREIYDAQVEQCRRHFDEQLAKLRGFMAEQGMGGSETTATAGGSAAWGKKVLHSLHNEKHKLLQLVDKSAGKLRGVEKEAVVLGKFNSSLRDNIVAYQLSLDATVTELTAVESAHRAQVRSLEAALQMKMDMLSNSATNGSSSSCKGGDVK